MKDFDIITVFFVYYEQSIHELQNAKALKGEVTWAKKNNKKIIKITVCAYRNLNHSVFSDIEKINELDITNLLKL